MKKVFFILFVLAAIQLNAAIYYVSNSGSDSNNGTSDGTAWQTLAKVNSTALNAGDQVLFRKGDTFYGTLNATYSGTSGNQIVYGAYGTGANPVITGFTSVTAWTNLGSNIWESTNAVTSLATVNMVSIGGVNTAMGRYPNSGYFTYQSNTTNSITSSNLDGVINWTGAELMVRRNYYFQLRTPITGQSGSTISFDNALSLANGYGFFIQNDVRTLDQQNEWYFNTTTKKIRIYSTSQPQNVKVASVQYLVHFSNTNSPTSYVTIENIDFTGANERGIFRWSFGLADNRAHHITVDGCNISFCGINGISLRGNYTTITDCQISDINGTGINLGSNAWNTVEQNTITNIGLYFGMIQTASEFYYGSTNGINTQNTQNSSISYNTITNCGYNGINFGGQTTRNTTIKNNRIDNYCVVAGDGGAIYGSYHSSAVIDGNIVSNGVAPIEGTNQSFAQAVGIYLDDNTDSCEIKNNVIFNISCYGLQYNSTSNISTHHNLIYSSGRNELRLQRWTDELPLEKNDFSYNQFVTTSSSQKVISLISYENDIPTFGTFNNNVYARPLANTTIISLSQPSIGSISYTLDQWQTFSSQDANSTGSPITVASDDYIFFDYTTSNSKTVTLTQPMLQLDGTKVSGSVTIPAYSSLVLLPQAAYYVSNAGSDTNDGLTPETPWKTIAKVNSTTFPQGSNILFKRGDTWHEMLNLHNNGGASGSPQTYAAYGTGNKPKLSGFITITGWTNEGGGIYSKAIVSESQTNMVTIDGVQYAMGRYPNSSNLTYESHSTNVSITDNQLSSSPDWDGAEVVIWKNAYSLDRCTITNHTGTTISYTSLGTTDNATNGNEYFIQNDIRTLDQFGEWYHDANAGKFYMYFGAVNPTTKVVKVATLDNLVFSGSGEDYFNFQNLAFEGSIKNALDFTWSQDHFNITDCDISHTGLSGINCAGTYFTIDGCAFSNINRIGVHLEATNSTVSNCTFTNIGMKHGQGSISGLYRGAILNYRTSNTILANSIENTGFSSIVLDGTSAVATVKNNYIKNAVAIAQDQGAIYLYGTKTSILIQNNIIEGSTNSSGIYLDEVTTNTRVVNNTIYDSYYGIKLHKANNCAVKNNICYNNNAGLDLENWLNVRYLYNDSIVGNQFIAKTAGQYSVQYINWYNDNAIGYLSGNVYARPIDDDDVFATNILGVSSNKTLAQWKTLTGSDVNSTKSPITSSEFVFFTNKTASVTYPKLPYASIDMIGTKKTGFVTLQPYSSFIGLKDPNPATPIVISKLLKSGGKFLKVGDKIMAIPQ